MSERTNRFSEELKRLIAKGDMLLMAIQYDCHPDQFVELVKKSYDGDIERTEKYLKKLPSFKTDYQKWYTEAQAVIKQVLPDRLADFASYYEFPRVRKDIIFQNYMVRDYLRDCELPVEAGTKL